MKKYELCDLIDICLLDQLFSYLLPKSTELEIISDYKELYYLMQTNKCIKKHFCEKIIRFHTFTSSNTRYLKTDTFNKIKKLYYNQFRDIEPETLPKDLEVLQCIYGLDITIKAQKFPKSLKYFDMGSINVI